MRACLHSLCPPSSLVFLAYLACSGVLTTTSSHHSFRLLSPDSASLLLSRVSALPTASPGTRTLAITTWIYQLRLSFCEIAQERDRSPVQTWVVRDQSAMAAMAAMGCHPRTMQQSQAPLNGLTLIPTCQSLRPNRYAKPLFRAQVDIHPDDCLSTHTRRINNTTATIFILSQLPLSATCHDGTTVPKDGQAKMLVLQNCSREEKYLIV
jgi:hypothetical protein